MYHSKEADLNTKSSVHLSIAIDEHTIVQAELSAYIDQQAQEIAPEPEIQFMFQMTVPKVGWGKVAKISSIDENGIWLKEVTLRFL